MKPVLELFQDRLGEGQTIALPACPRVVYAVKLNSARYTTGPVQLGPELGSHLLRYELTGERRLDSQLSAELELSSGAEYLLRCDRVELPSGGIALLHTHRGPGIRCLVEGRFRVDVNGLGHTVERYGAWYENGKDPVEARAVSDGPAAFVRVMVLPRQLLGRTSIQYVREDDRDRPKPQRYQVFVDEPIEL
jgi:hypothetical protein